MRITEKGQVTIPKAVREAAGLMPGTDVEFEIVDGAVRIVKATRGRKPTRGQLLVERLRALKGSGMTADEVMAMTRGETRDDGAP